MPELEKPVTEETLAAYDERADHFAANYEATDRTRLQDMLKRWVTPGSRVLEIGCGSGCDARYLAAFGARVTATDGSTEMLRRAEALARETDPEHRPDFKRLDLTTAPHTFTDLARKLGLPDTTPKFDLVTAIALLQHLNETALFNTVLMIDAALTQEGIIIFSVPLDHPDDHAEDFKHRRTFYQRPPESYLAAFERIGFAKASLEVLEKTGAAGSECAWATMVLVRAPGQAKAKSTIRGIIEGDKKLSTYKFALLRALCEINIEEPELVRYISSDLREPGKLARAQTAIPFSLIVLRFIKYYWTIAMNGREMVLRDDPLSGVLSFKEDVPRQNYDGANLAFQDQLFALMRHYCGDWSLFEESFFSGRLAQDLSGAQAFQRLADQVATTISKGPVTYAGNSLDIETSFASEVIPGRREQHNRLFRVAGGRKSRYQAILPSEMKLRYGDFFMPAELWRELTATAPFVLDSILLSWAEESMNMSRRHNAAFTTGQILERMLPKPDERNTRLARSIFESAMRSIHSFASGRKSRCEQGSTSTTSCPGRVRIRTTFGISYLPTKRPTSKSPTPSLR